MNFLRTTCLKILAPAILCGALTWPVAAPAQNTALVPPPKFSACAPATPPVLPPRWRTTALMSPFFLDEQLDIAEFVYDGTLPAMRATVYGLQSGAVDLLITATETYRLSGPHDSPTGCASLKRKFKPPSAQWLSAQATCVGEVPLGKIPVQWWKQPGADSKVIWHWFKTDTRLPWRSLFVAPAVEPAIIGDYAMSYFPDFAPLAKTNLPRLRDFCRTHKKTETVDTGATTARALMAIGNDDAEAERPRRIAALIPGVNYQACTGKTLPRWPDQFVMTAILAPISFNDDPYLSMIYYDWSEAATQLVVMWQGNPPTYKGLSALKNGIGYQPGRLPSGVFACQAIYPGLLRPDWMTNASCQCKGVIDRHPMLSPNEATQIIACPIKNQARRVMWNWYTDAERPVVFLEAAATRAAGLMLADYFEWRPGQKVPASNFDLPGICTAPDSSQPRAGDSGNRSCADCHTLR